MCCYSRPKSTQAVQRQLQRGKNRFFKVWMVCAGADELKSPCMWHPVHITKTGIVASNRRKSGLLKGEEKSLTVDRGIHVFRKRKGADDICHHSGHIVVPVYGELENLVAAGGDTAVFTKIKVKREDLEEALTNVFFKLFDWFDGPEGRKAAKAWVEKVLKRSHEKRQREAVAA